MLKNSHSKKFWLINYDFNENIFTELLLVLVNLIEKSSLSCEISGGLMFLS